MDDLILRRQAIDTLRKKQDNGKGDISRFYNAIIQHDIEAIMQLPSVRPDLSEYSDKLWQKAYECGKAEAQAEIVRCKDCRFNTYSKKCLNPDSFFLVPADDFYCGYAERRTDERFNRQTNGD